MSIDTLCEMNWEGGMVSVKDTASSAGGGCIVPRPSEERTNTDFYLKTKARIWPRLSFMCHVRSRAYVLLPRRKKKGVCIGPGQNSLYGISTNSSAPAAVPIQMLSPRTTNGRG